MKLVWEFSLCLCYLATVAWGQSFNPRPLSQRPRQTPNVVLPRNFSPESVREAFATAEQVISDRRTSFQGRRANRPPSARSIPEARHQSFLQSRARSQGLANTQERFEEACRVLRTDFSLDPEQIRYGLGETNLSSILRGNEVPTCEAQFNISNCNPNDRFRTFDGSCNNIRHPSWGMASSCFERLITEADYEDGCGSKRVAMSGNELPAPRRVSLEIHNHLDNPTDYVTHMFMVWGQFLDHDISLTPLALGPDNEILECCPVNDDDPDDCDPIVVQNDDPFYSSFNTICLDNARSARCSTCTLGPRQQTNQVTTYIDASHIYALNLNESQALRTRDGSGTMRFVAVNGAGELLPPSARPAEDQCSDQDPNFDCFQTGDQRANQHPALTAMHTIFLREHNRIARRLREINPRWSGERVYQEARRIVGAEMQMITYNEYLPLVIGPERMEWFDLSVRQRNQFTEYDETVQATLVNEFSTGAFRFGHSMINSFFREDRANNGGNFLRDIFNFPFELYRGQLEGIVSGLTTSPSQKFDRHMVRDVTNHLYQARGNGSGLDLASLNINRGRDHGIPGYTSLVDFCGGPDITTWRQLDRLFQRGVRPFFERLYERVEDIDLFSGGLAERPNQGAVIGPTFTCIIGIQFYHLKYGDRFYFEHAGQSGSFTPAQLREIKKVTLGKIICDNTDVNEITDNIFLYASNRNPMERCNNKENMDLNAWRE